MNLAPTGPRRERLVVLGLVTLVAGSLLWIELSIRRLGAANDRRRLQLDRLAAVVGEPETVRPGLLAEFNGLYGRALSRIEIGGSPVVAFADGGSGERP